ncbi:ABC-type Fe3+-citrate transport system, periplasmic component [Hahella chejuensis KCTC 2396]|uniref:ABC-type Fe3+-citrate transport system, periplasmic component n=1 Tax=Hahella chejuensis (strain KCTC 2396) TaxID=349521 RepID=Q2SM66_HAHCH|nr:iron-siderophore ABC transporter substrate-binding protein [Hahella chejuensis]ABC28258.1 ABC-type Fe3+-citrate transport system, periplasmic component [Hahella chejuensis KCTC 2396]
MTAFFTLMFTTGAALKDRRPLIAATSILTFIASASAQAITVTDSRGEHEFAQTPQRVIALNWSMAENLVELGVTPTGVADIKGYREWVVRPQLADSITDVGTRAEPNIERIAALKPDVILISSMQEGMLEKLEQVAPVLFFDSFRADHDNFEVSKQIFLQLARLFHKETTAQQKLEAMEARFGELRTQLTEHYHGALPKVAAVRFTTPSVLRIFGDNSMAQAAMTKLGLQPALPQPATQWGITQKKVTDLGRIKDGVVIYIEPFEQADDLFSAPLWRAMPFVRGERFAAARSTWTYGGPLSVQYLAESITDALLTLTP